MPEERSTQRDVKNPEEAAGILLDIVAQVLRDSGSSGRQPEVGLDASLEADLGIDSLTRMELLLRIEKAFSVRLPQGLLGEAETPRDLLRAALAAKGEPGAEARAMRIEFAPASEQDRPKRAATLLEVLNWHVELHGERTHLVLLNAEEGEVDGKSMTYARLHEEAICFSAGLKDMGVGHGQAVAMMLPTCWDFFPMFFGILFAGAVPVPMYPPARIAQLGDHLSRQAGILANCGASLLVTVAEARRFTDMLRKHVPSLHRVLTPEELRRDATARPPMPVSENDTALLQYTSGSTGNPKGVVLSHAQLLANIRAMGQAAAVRPDDVFVSWLPLYHDMGLIGAWLGSLYFALPLVVMPPTAFLTRPTRWLWAIHRYRGTLSSAPNFAYEMLATRVPESGLQGLDLRSWRKAFNGAEPVSAGTLLRFSKRFSQYGLRPEALAPVYGLAECAVGLAFPPPDRGPLIDCIDRKRLAESGEAQPAGADDADPLRCVACGRPLPGHQIRIAGPGGRELPERIEGRVQFRGPSATCGYFHNAEATRRLFEGEWLETGDLGYIAAGELYITGRAKDIIIRGGRHVHPEELEEAAGEVRGVRKGCVAVFGVPDVSTGTERIVLLAETRVSDRRQQDVLRAALASLVLERLDMPADDIVLAPPHTVLKTSSGKIRRAANSELYQRGWAGAGGLKILGLRALVSGAAAKTELSRLLGIGAELSYSAYACLVFSILALASFFLLAVPHRQWRRSAIRAMARAFLSAIGLRPVVIGQDRFPAQAPVIVVCNHASYLDAIVLFALLPTRCIFVAKKELLASAGTGAVLLALDTQFVERFDRGLSVSDAGHLMAAARRGMSLVFFPEGTFSRAPGLQSFHLGAFLASIAAGVPVLPVAIRGTRSALREGQWLLHRVRLEVCFAELLRPEGEDWAAAVRLRDLARAEILSRCGEPDAAPRS